MCALEFFGEVEIVAVAAEGGNGLNGFVGFFEEHAGLGESVLDNVLLAY